MSGGGASGIRLSPDDAGLGGGRPFKARYDPRVENYVLTELDSGERVISERLGHVRSAAVGYWIGAGSRDEQPSEAGVTHFIEHLLFKGTPRRGPGVIDQTNSTQTTPSVVSAILAGTSSSSRVR